MIKISLKNDKFCLVIRTHTFNSNIFFSGRLRIVLSPAFFFALPYRKSSKYMVTLVMRCILSRPMTLCCAHGYGK